MGGRLLSRLALEPENRGSEHCSLHYHASQLVWTRLSNPLDPDRPLIRIGECHTQYDPSVCHRRQRAHPPQIQGANHAVGSACLDHTAKSRLSR
jgi:hypothetical protein